MLLEHTHESKHFSFVGTDSKLGYVTPLYKQSPSPGILDRRSISGFSSVTVSGKYVRSGTFVLSSSLSPGYAFSGMIVFISSDSSSRCLSNDEAVVRSSVCESDSIR